MEEAEFMEGDIVRSDDEYFREEMEVIRVSAGEVRCKWRENGDHPLRQVIEHTFRTSELHLVRRRAEA